MLAGGVPQITRWRTLGRISHEKGARAPPWVKARRSDECIDVCTVWSPVQVHKQSICAVRSLDTHRLMLFWVPHQVG